MNQELIYIFEILAGMFVLVPACGLFIHALIHIGRYARVGSKWIVYFLIGFGSALPELTIALSAVFKGMPIVALGNSLGTSFVALSLVAGVVAVFNHNFQTKKFFETHDFGHLSLTVVLLMMLSMDGVLDVTDGILLLLSFTYFLLNLKSVKDHPVMPETKHINLPKYIALSLISIVAIYFAANYSLDAVSGLTNLTSIPVFLIAVTLLAPLGAVPELIVELELNKRKVSQLTFGELFTSVVINCSLVIGLVAILTPIRIVEHNLFYFTSIALILLLIIFNYFVRSKSNLNWREGVMLILAYVIFVVGNFVTLIY